MRTTKDLVLIDLTVEEYWEIFKYTEKTLSRAWVEKYQKKPGTKGYFGNQPEKADISANFIGILGECALNKAEGKPVSQTLAERPVRKSDAGFDIVIGDMKYDIKVLRSLKGKRPKLDWRYNISKHLIDQQKDCDAFFWISMVRYPDRRAAPWYWLAVGWLTKKEFLEKANFHKTGDKSITGNEFVFKSPAYDIAVRQMHPYKDIPR